MKILEDKDFVNQLLEKINPDGLELDILFELEIEKNIAQQNRFMTNEKKWLFAFIILLNLLLITIAYLTGFKMVLLEASILSLIMSALYIDFMEDRLISRKNDYQNLKHIVNRKRKEVYIAINMLYKPSTELIFLSIFLNKMKYGYLYSKFGRQYLSLFFTIFFSNNIYYLVVGNVSKNQNKNFYKLYTNAKNHSVSTI